MIELLTHELPNGVEQSGLDKKALYETVIAESSKTYLTKEVEEINEVKLFLPYKNLCERIAALFLEYSPAYPYPHSLASTLVEMAHLQNYFMLHLPRLTDARRANGVQTIADFLENLAFSALHSKN